MEHLTRLTRLEIPSLSPRYDSDGVDVDVSDGVLPPNLGALKVRMHSISVQPVLSLQQLRDLELWEWADEDEVPPVQLLSLTRLSNLTNLSLTLECDKYKQPKIGHPEVWAALPLRSLTIKSDELEAIPDYVITGLTALHDLTRLDMTCTIPGDALLQALPSCKQLRVLRLDGNLVFGSASEDDTEDDVSLCTESEHDDIDGDVDIEMGDAADANDGVDEDACMRCGMLSEIKDDAEVVAVGDVGDHVRADANTTTANGSSGCIHAFDRGYLELLQVVDALPNLRECFIQLLTL
eukprot:GHUV01034250.1.p1 GENE.GHUV01034250.1~~GHUV01034250.1.p1  ORF type:complete len:294 (-),score=66.77 GHUV01034250.1:1232-2113(-)